MITKELREYVWKKVPSKHLEDLIGIADRIESRYEDCEGFARRLEDAAGNREEVTLFGVDYIPLPKDADGKPIHPMDWLVGPKGETRCVEAVCKSFFAAWCPERSCFEVYPAYEFSHKDTWRAVVEDAYKGHFDSFDALVERCKKLAGEE